MIQIEAAKSIHPTQEHLENQSELVYASLSLMQAITRHFGAEKGHDIWQNIATSLGPELKYEIFMAMITGEFNSTILIRGHEPMANRVAMIKALRDVANLPLKEAKDMVDALTANGSYIRTRVHSTKQSSHKTTLRNAGFWI